MSAAISLIGETSATARTWLRGIIYYLVAATALVLALSRFREQAEKLFGHQFFGFWFILASLPLFGVFVSHTLPILVRRRRDARLKSWGVTIRERTAFDYFRTTPYQSNAQDRARYTRADGMHHAVKKWIYECSEQILFLSGTSGSGKTSLLSAYALPELQEGIPRVVSIVLRSFDDPVSTMRSALLKKGAIWDRPPDITDEVPAILKRAADHLGQEQLLLVFDQFEEFLILHERSDARAAQFADMLGSIRRQPISGIKFLFVLRSDYIGLLQRSEWLDLLPSMRQGTNWFEIGGFRERDAREFIERSGLQVGPQLMDKIFTDIQEIEDTPGLVRPISLNILGIALDAAATQMTQLIKSRRAGGLIVEYLAQQIKRPVVRSHAPRILSFMVTPMGTKEPRDAASLAQLTGFAVEAVRGCLLHLSNSGIVRSIDRQQEVWEIAHDFIARLLANILMARPDEGWKRARQLALPTSVIVWAVAFIALPSIFPPTLRPADLKAKISIDTDDPGDPEPPEFRTGVLSLGIGRHKSGESSTVPSKIKLEPGTTMTADAIVKPAYREGEQTEQTYHQVVEFNAFSGSLGDFRYPNYWENAYVWAELTGQLEKYQGDFDSESLAKQYEEYYGKPPEEGSPLGIEINLTLNVNGVQVVTLSGLLVDISGVGSHGMPNEYSIEFLPSKIKTKPRL